MEKLNNILNGQSQQDFPLLRFYTFKLLSCILSEQRLGELKGKLISRLCSGLYNVLLLLLQLYLHLDVHF